MMVSIDRVLLLLVARSGDPTEEHGEKAKAEGKRALAEAVEEQNAAGEKMGQTLVDRLVAALVRKVQLSISNVHVRIQGSPDSDGIAGGAMVRSIRIDTPPQEAREGRTDARARSRLEEELSRKRLTVEGLAVYLDTTAAFGSVIESDNQPSGSPSGARSNAVPNADPTQPSAAAVGTSAAADAASAAADAASAAASSAADAAGSGGMFGWEARMLAMISAQAGPAHIFGPADLSLDATFDLTGKVRAGDTAAAGTYSDHHVRLSILTTFALLCTQILAHTLDMPRFMVEVDVKNDLALSISNGQMEVLKSLGGALGAQQKREKFRTCRRPRMMLLPSSGVGGQRRNGKRPPTAAAVAWWSYAKRCVLQTLREKSGSVGVAETANKARIHEEYMRTLTEDYHRRLSLNAAARARPHVTAACAPGEEVAAVAAEADVEPRRRLRPGEQQYDEREQAQQQRRQARLLAFEARMEVSEIIECRRRARHSYAHDEAELSSPTRQPSGLSPNASSQLDASPATPTPWFFGARGVPLAGRQRTSSRKSRRKSRRSR